MNSFLSGNCNIAVNIAVDLEGMEGLGSGQIVNFRFVGLVESSSRFVLIKWYLKGRREIKKITNYHKSLILSFKAFLHGD